MTPRKIGGYTILDQRTSPSGSTTYTVAPPNGRRIVVHVPRRLSGPDALLASLEAVERPFLARMRPR